MKKDLHSFCNFLAWIKPDLLPYIPGLAIIILIDITGALMGVGTALASKSMVDYAVEGKLNLAGLAAAVLGGLIIFRMLMSIGSSLLSVRILEAFSNSMRQRFFRRLMVTEWQPLAEYHSGDLLTRLTSDVKNITGFFVDVIPHLFALGAQLTASFLALMYFEPRLAVLAFLLGPATVLFSRIWGRKLKKIHIKVQETESTYRSYIQEALQNFVIIKSFQLEQRNSDNLQSLHQDRMRWVLQRNKTTLAANNVISLGYWAGYFLAFGWGVIRLSQKAISFGTLTAFLQLVQQVQGPFIGIASTFPRLMGMIGSAERVRELEKLSVEKTTETVPNLKQVGIVFDKVGFAYQDGETVLTQVTTEILPGQLVALVGSSGEGKTTMIRLLLALLRPREGEVYFTDIKGNRYEVSATTRTWLTYVPQGNTLFSGSIAENLRSGKPEASEKEIEEACRAACAWDFILELPLGINTIIGERGLGLSEGQAQRIAIARAFLKKSPILILDEATSALDLETEMNILNSIERMNCGQTCLVITHRPSALSICSRVLRINEGQLSEEI